MVEMLQREQSFLPKRSAPLKALEFFSEDIVMCKPGTDGRPCVLDVWAHGPMEPVSREAMRGAEVFPAGIDKNLVIFDLWERLTVPSRERIQ